MLSENRSSSDTQTTPPLQHALPADAVSQADVKARLDFIVRESLSPVALMLTALLAVYVVLHLFDSNQSIGLRLAVVDLLAAGGCTALWVTLRRWHPPLVWAHPLAVGLILLVLVDILAEFYLTKRVRQTTNLMILLFGISFFLLRWRWLVAMTVVIWLSWALTVAAIGGPRDSTYFATSLMSATALAALVHFVHTRTLTRLEHLQSKNENSKTELGRAIWENLQNEMRFRQLSMATFEGIIVHDQGTILDSNLAAALLFGTQPGQLVGQSFLDYFTPPSRALILEKIATGNETPYDVMMIKQTGDVVPIEMRGRTIPFQGQLARVVALHDISRRLKAEQELLSAKEYAERLYRIVPAAVFTVDLYGTLTSVNNRAVEILGYSQDELIGRSCRFFTLSPCDQQCSLCDANTVKPVHDVECLIRTKQGEIRTVLKNVELLLKFDGTPIGGIESFEDVTERKQREKKLRQLSRAVEQSPNIVVITDYTGTIEYVNLTFETVTGYTADEAIGQNPRILKSGHMPRSVYDELWSTILAGTDWRGELLNRKKNGDLYWEMCHIAPVRGEKGEVTHFIALKEDITARKQAEEALKDSLFRSQALFQASEDLLMAGSLKEVLQAAVDSAVTALYVDRAVINLVDIEARTVTHHQKGGPGTQHVIPIAFDELWDGLSGWAMREKTAVFSPKGAPDPRESPAVQQRRHETHCGDILVVPLLHRNIPLGTLTAINNEGGRSFTPADIELLEALANQAVIAIDNARLLDSVRESEEKFSKVFHATPDAISISTLGDGLNIDINEGFVALTGYTREEIVGHTMYELDLWVDDEEFNRFISLLRTQGTVQNLAASMYHKSGEMRHILLSSDTFDLGGIKHLLTIVKDVTELTRTAQEREQLIQELDSFARTVAHDLKNPISPILGYAEMLIDEGDGLPPDMQRMFLQEIFDSAHRMDNIIDELLLLARMRQGDIHPEPLAMDLVVEQVERRMDYMLRQFESTLVLPEAWPKVMGYGPWIEDVWVNYISNALKYGGRPPQVTLGVDLVSDTVARFWVQDNGAGLTPEQQNVLFVPYTQLRQVRIEGHGLGLSIVQRIITKLDGEVGVESTLGAGSRFFFTLPRVDESNR